VIVDAVVAATLIATGISSAYGFFRSVRRDAIQQITTRIRPVLLSIAVDGVLFLILLAGFEAINFGIRALLDHGTMSWAISVMTTTTKAVMTSIFCVYAVSHIVAVLKAFSKQHPERSPTSE